MLRQSFELCFLSPRVSQPLLALMPGWQTTVSVPLIPSPPQLRPARHSVLTSSNLHFLWQFSLRALCKGISALEPLGSAAKAAQPPTPQLSSTSSPLQRRERMKRQSKLLSEELSVSVPPHPNKRHFSTFRCFSFQRLNHSTAQPLSR